MDQRQAALLKKKAEGDQNMFEEDGKPMDSNNPWTKICQNVALKEGEYPGNRDVKSMRSAIVNKKSDNNY